MNIIDRLAWQDRAACRDMDVSIFFPDAHGGPIYRRARAICQGCPVVAQCLDYTLAHESRANDTRHGYAGGATPREREAILRERERRAS